jgi:hypothetical protein
VTLLSDTELREALCGLPPRVFGDITQAIAMGHLGGTTKFGSGANDGDWVGDRIEAKFSVAYAQMPAAAKKEAKGKSPVDLVEAYFRFDRAVVPAAEWETHDFKCNMNNVKTDHFDCLCYGVMFAEKVCVFLAPVAAVHTFPGLCKQSGRNGGDGKHFFVERRNFKWHLDNYHLSDLGWDEVRRLLERWPTGAAA